MKFLNSNKMKIVLDMKSIKKDIFWLKVCYLFLAIGQMALAVTLIARHNRDAYDADTDYGPVIHLKCWNDDVAPTNRWSCGHLIEPDTNRSVHGWIPTGCGECERKQKEKTK